MDTHQNLTLVDDWGIPPSASSSVQSIVSSNESEHAASVFASASNTAFNGESKPFSATNNGMSTVPSIGAIYNNLYGIGNAQYPGGPYHGLMGWSTMPNSLYQTLDYGWQLPSSATSSMQSGISSIQSEGSAFKPFSSHANGLPAVPQYPAFGTSNNAVYLNGPNPTPSASSESVPSSSSGRHASISSIVSDDILRSESSPVSSHFNETPTAPITAGENPTFNGPDVKPFPNELKQEPGSNYLPNQYGYPQQQPQTSYQMPPFPMNSFAQRQSNPYMQLIDSGMASTSTPTMPEVKHLPKSEPQVDKKPRVDTLYAVREDISEDALKERIKVTLEEQSLWAKFADIDVEMIVTKTGRNLFPKLAFNVAGLEPRNRYLFYVEFRLVTEEKWRYINAKTGWEGSGKADAYSPTVYAHPENVNFPTGSAWMENPFTFNAKLTNQIERNGKGRFIYVPSMHKYIPVVMIHRYDPATKNFNTFTEIEIPAATFVATTCYQSDKCKVVKVDHNPFARGFRVGGRKRKNMERKAAGEGSPASPPVPEPFNPFSRLNQTYPPGFLPNYFGMSNPAFYWSYMSSLAQQHAFPPPPPPPVKQE